MSKPRFVLVVPTFQADAYLDACLGSILGQEGGFELRLHVQDGGSTDATMETVERWGRQLAQARVTQRDRIHFTSDSRPDTGVYDAIARGFEAIQPRPDDIMTWLNADDVLASGAFAAVASCMRQLPEVRLCGGRGAALDRNGRTIRTEAAVARPRALVAAGLYDGRQAPFIMQEGTFWSGSLWHEVGGLDTGFRLAGDWDLWRRMARFAPHVTLDTLTGFFRIRPGQLSANLDAYYAEIDRRLDDGLRGAYEQTAEAFARAGRSPEDRPDDFNGLIARLDQETDRWRLVPQGDHRTPPSRLIHAGRAVTPVRGEAVSGAAAAEGPYPQWGLPAGVRWISEQAAHLSVFCERAGFMKAVLTCRAGTTPARLTIAKDGEPLLSTTVSPEDPARDCDIAFEFWAEPGFNTLELETLDGGGSYHRLLLIDLKAHPLQPPARPAFRPSADMAVVVIDDGRPQALARTLNALSRQTLRPEGVVVIQPHPFPATASVLDEFSPGVTTIEASPHPVQTARARLDGFNARHQGLLPSGAHLQPDALALVVAAFETMNADVIVGARMETDPQDRRSTRLASAPATDSALFLRTGAPVAPTPDGGPFDTAVLLRDLVAAGAVATPLPIVLETGAHGRGGGRLSAETSASDHQDDRALALLDRLGADAGLADALRERLDTTLHDRIADALFLERIGPRPRQAARRRLGLDAARRIVGLEPGAPARQIRELASAGAALVMFGPEGQPPASESGVVRISATDDPELVSWALSACDETLFQSGGRMARGAARACKADNGEEGVEALIDPAMDIAQTVRAALNAEDADLTHLSAPQPAPMRLHGPDGAPRIRGGGSLLATHPPGQSTARLWAEPADGPARLTLSSDGESRTLDIEGRVLVEARLEPGGLTRIDIDAVRTVRGKLVAATVDFEIAAPRPSEALTPDAVSAAPWARISGFDVEEPPAPQFGLHQPFQWSLPGCRIRILGAVEGRRRVTIAYRTAVGGQTLSALREGDILAASDPARGQLEQLEQLVIELDVPDGGQDIELEASEHLKADRILAFIIEEVTVETIEPSGAS